MPGRGVSCSLPARVNAVTVVSSYILLPFPPQQYHAFPSSSRKRRKESQIYLSRWLNRARYGSESQRLSSSGCWSRLRGTRDKEVEEVQEEVVTQVAQKSR